MEQAARSRKTAAAILRAAHEEFAERGPEGARVDRIAENAGANKQRIYAYFGSKEGLFTEVLSSAFAQLAAAVPIPTTREGLRSYAGEVFDYHRQNHSLIRLLAWEGLHYRASPLDTGYSRAAYYQNSVANLSRVIGVDAATVSRLLFTIIAVASWPHVVPQQRRLLTVGTDHESSSDLDTLRDAVSRAGEAITDQLCGLQPTQ